LGGGKKDGSDYGASSDKEDEAKYYMGVDKDTLMNTPESGLTEAEVGRGRVHKLQQLQHPVETPTHSLRNHPW
jgi:hypothetical protein